MANRETIELDIRINPRVTKKMKNLLNDSHGLKTNMKKVSTTVIALNRNLNITHRRLRTIHTDLTKIRNTNAFSVGKQRAYNRELQRTNRLSRQSARGGGGLPMRMMGGRGMGGLRGGLGALRGGLGALRGLGGMAGAAGGPIGIAIGVAMAAATAAAKPLIDAGASRQRTRTVFNTLFKGKGSQTMGAIDELANRTPLQNEDLYRAARTLGAFGVNRKKIPKHLEMLGDLALGDKTKLMTLSNVFGRAKGSGKLTGELRNMALETAQVDILGLIAKDTGRSIEDLTKAMSKGQISFDMVTSAMRRGTSEGGRYHGMMEKISETYEGKLSTFQGKWNTLMAELGEKILPVATLALNGLISSLDALKGDDPRSKFKISGAGGELNKIITDKNLTYEQKLSAFDTMLGELLDPDDKKYDKVSKKYFKNVVLDFAESPEFKKAYAAQIKAERELDELNTSGIIDKSSKYYKDAKKRLEYHTSGRGIEEARAAYLGLEKTVPGAKTTAATTTTTTSPSQLQESNKDIIDGGVRTKNINITIQSMKSADQIIVESSETPEEVNENFLNNLYTLLENLS